MHPHAVTILLHPHTHTQDFDTLASYIQNQQGSPFLAVMSDFHLLLYLYTNDIAGIALKVQ